MVLKNIKFCNILCWKVWCQIEYKLDSPILFRFVYVIKLMLVFLHLFTSVRYISLSCLVSLLPMSLQVPWGRTCLPTTDLPCCPDRPKTSSTLCSAPAWAAWRRNRKRRRARGGPSREYSQGAKGGNRSIQSSLKVRTHFVCSRTRIIDYLQMRAFLSNELISK